MREEAVNNNDSSSSSAARTVSGSRRIATMRRRRLRSKAGCTGASACRRSTRTSRSTPGAADTCRPAARTSRDAAECAWRHGTRCSRRHTLQQVPCASGPPVYPMRHKLVLTPPFYANRTKHTSHASVAASASLEPRTRSVGGVSKRTTCQPARQHG